MELVFLYSNSILHSVAAFNNNNNILFQYQYQFT